MSSMQIYRIFKDYALLWSMVVGVFLSPWAYKLAFLLPYIMFVMLSLSYTRIAPSDVKMSKVHIALFVTQWVLGVGIYFALRSWDEILAQGLALIILTPTAVSASVITAMMGGNMGFIIASLIIGNVAMSLLAPPMLSSLYPDTGLSYLATVLQILSKVSLLLIMPIVLIWGLRFGLPKVHDRLAKYAGWTFYFWCFSLVIITSNTIRFFKEHGELTLQYGVVIALSVFVVCLLTFVIGRSIGRRMGTLPVNSGQALGQKNTVLAIWVGLTFMNPVVSVIPSFYVIWQNVVNAFQLAQYRRSVADQTNNPPKL